MANYIYAIWFGAKTVELLSLGQLGSNLAFTVSKTIYLFLILTIFVFKLDGLSQLYVLPNPMGANPAVLYKSPG